MLKDTFPFLILRHQEKMLPTLMEGISNDQLSAQPVAGMNHPAWILGHLLAIEQKIAGDILGCRLKISLDSGWWDVYGIGSTPKPDRKIYQSIEFYIKGLAETAEQIAIYVKQKTDAELDAPNTDPQLSKAFPTISIALGAAVAHRAYHTGQLATWRKAMGMPHAGM